MNVWLVKRHLENIYLNQYHGWTRNINHARTFPTRRAARYVSRGTPIKATVTIRERG